MKNMTLIIIIFTQKSRKIVIILNIGIMSHVIQNILLLIDKCFEFGWEVDAFLCKNVLKIQILARYKIMDRQ